MDEDAANANKVILRVVTDKEGRLRFGAARRQEMLETIAQGKEPQGYRPDWIRETTMLLFRLMASRAALFNTIHPRDRISTHDFHDVLVNAVGKLNKA